jgi:CheY-like chemotaxis protein
MACQTASDGKQALEMLRAARRDNPFDLAILDMMIPGMNGIELAQTIHNDGAISPLRIMLLTPISHEIDRKQLQQCGVSAFVTKPIRPARLYQDIVALFQRGNQAIADPVPEKPMVQWKQVPHILVAEDNPVNQQVIQSALEVLSCKVDMASNGQEAVKAWSQHRHAIIFMDGQMPIMDGYEATAHIRKAESIDADNSTKPRTVIIALTGLAMKGDREKFLMAGMDDYLVKPFKLDALNSMLSRWVPTTPLRTKGQNGIASALGGGQEMRQREHAGPATPNGSTGDRYGS